MINKTRVIFVVRLILFFNFGIVISLVLYGLTHQRSQLFVFNHNKTPNLLAGNLSEFKISNGGFDIVNFCDEEIKKGKSDLSERLLCYQGPLVIENKGLEIDLATKKIIFIEGGKIIKIRDLLYQSPEDKWFQSPTGFFRIKSREKLHFSTIGLVWLPYSMGYYEDFFLHGIPYRDNGERLTSTVSGGCLRFSDEVAKEIYEFVRINDPVLVYVSLDKYKIKDGFFSPINKEEAFIFQRFYTPLRVSRNFSGDRDNLKFDYYNHTGLDFKLKKDATDNNVYAIADGRVIEIIINGINDFGMGNSIILEHEINGEKIYSLYAHLSSINSELKKGDIIKGGQVIGKIGASGYGCLNYWRLEKNGCNSNSEINHHLHFEIKKEAVLYNPFGGKTCFNKELQTADYCFRYAPDPLFSKGYLNPLEFLYEKHEK